MSADAEVMDRMDRLERLLLGRLAALEAVLVGAAGVAAADDDGWHRLPAPGDRCPVSRWSRSTVLRAIERGDVRSKSVQGARYYALADIRKILGK